MALRSLAGGRERPSQGRAQAHRGPRRRIRRSRGESPSGRRERCAASRLLRRNGLSSTSPATPPRRSSKASSGPPITTASCTKAVFVSRRRRRQACASFRRTAACWFRRPRPARAGPASWRSTAAGMASRSAATPARALGRKGGRRPLHVRAPPGGGPADPAPTQWGDVIPRLSPCASFLFAPGQARSAEAGAFPAAAADHLDHEVAEQQS